MQSLLCIDFSKSDLSFQIHSQLTSERSQEFQSRIEHISDKDGPTTTALLGLTWNKGSLLSGQGSVSKLLANMGKLHNDNQLQGASQSLLGRDS